MHFDQSPIGLPCRPEALGDNGDAARRLQHLDHAGYGLGRGCVERFTVAPNSSGPSKLSSDATLHRPGLRSKLRGNFDDQWCRMKSPETGCATPVRLICISSWLLLIVSVDPLAFAYTTVLPPVVTTSIA